VVFAKLQISLQPALVSDVYTSDRMSKISSVAPFRPQIVLNVRRMSANIRP